MHQEVQAGNGGGAGARAHQFYVLDFFTNDFQAVDDGRRRDDGSAVLVVMEDRYFHALAQLLFYVEAFRGFDVFQIDAAQRGLQRRNNVDQLVGISFRQLDVEHVDAGHFLEQASFAFHDRLGGPRADVAQTQNPRDVGDHADQLGARRETGRANDRNRLTNRPLVYRRLLEQK